MSVSPILLNDCTVLHTWIYLTISLLSNIQMFKAKFCWVFLTALIVQTTRLWLFRQTLSHLQAQRLKPPGNEILMVRSFHLAPDFSKPQALVSRKLWRDPPPSEENAAWGWKGLLITVPFSGIGLRGPLSDSSSPKLGVSQHFCPCVYPQPGPSHTLHPKNLFNYNLLPPKRHTVLLSNMPLFH